MRTGARVIVRAARRLFRRTRRLRTAVVLVVLPMLPGVRRSDRKPFRDAAALKNSEHGGNAGEHSHDSFRPAAHWCGEWLTAAQTSSSGRGSGATGCSARGHGTPYFTATHTPEAESRSNEPEPENAEGLEIPVRIELYTGRGRVYFC